MDQIKIHYQRLNHIKTIHQKWQLQKKLLNF